jgi:hypothetical protein
MTKLIIAVRNVSNAPKNRVSGVVISREPCVLAMAWTADQSWFIAW